MSHKWLYKIEPPECKSFAYIQADPVEVMEEIERLQNKMSQDYNGESGDLMKKIAPAVSPPLTFIYILSLETGIFPESWKISRTIPLFKSGSKSNPSNYRPIGIINAFSKVQEKLIHSRLLSFLNNTHFFNTNQFASCQIET